MLTAHSFTKTLLKIGPDYACTGSMFGMTSTPQVMSRILLLKPTLAPNRAIWKSESLVEHRILNPTLIFLTVQDVYFHAVVTACFALSPDCPRFWSY